MTGRPLSFRTRLTLRWTAAFGLLLACANTAVYMGVRAFAEHDLDANLRTRAATEIAGCPASRSTAERRWLPYSANEAASTEDMCLISAPAAKKPGSAEDTTMTLAGRLSAASSPLCRPSMMPGPKAFAGAWLRTISTIGPETRSATGEPL